MTVTSHNGKASKKFSQGLAAKKLGVTREHLNRVLRGHRVSRSLLQRYRTLAARYE